MSTFLTILLVYLFYLHQGESCAKIHNEVNVLTYFVDRGPNLRKDIKFNVSRLTDDIKMLCITNGDHTLSPVYAHCAQGSLPLCLSFPNSIPKGEPVTLEEDMIVYRVKFDLLCPYQLKFEDGSCWNFVSSGTARNEAGTKEIIRNNTAYPPPLLEHTVSNDGLHLVWSTSNVQHFLANKTLQLKMSVIVNNKYQLHINASRGGLILNETGETQLEAYFEDVFTRQSPLVNMTVNITAFPVTMTSELPAYGTDAWNFMSRTPLLPWVIVGVGTPLLLIVLAWYSCNRGKSSGEIVSCSAVVGTDDHHWIGGVNPMYFIEPKVNIERDPFNSSIEASELQSVRKLGEGHFGQVELNLWINSMYPQGIKVAVKTLKTTAYGLEREFAQYKNEIEIFRKVGTHPNIVKFLGFNTGTQPWFIVTEFMEKGDLANYLRSLRQDFKNSVEKQRIAANEEESQLLSDKYLSGSLSNRDLEFFGKEIATGMAHLEYCGVVHRDLAARNVLLGYNRAVKITDFGLSREGIYINSTKAELPIKWMAPETYIEQEHRCSSMSDVWSFGILLWEIGTLGGLPYDNMTPGQLIAFLKRGGRLERPEMVRECLYNLMQQCWHYDYRLRPSFTEIIQEFKNMSAYFEFSNLHYDYEFPPTYQNISDHS